MLAAVLALSISHLRALDIDRSMQGDWMVVSAVMAHRLTDQRRLGRSGGSDAAWKRVRSGGRSGSGCCAHLTVESRVRA